MSKKSTSIEYKSAADLRRSFVDYFVAKGHNHVPSASLVPGDDPSLLFTNSGMVPFKDVFLGKESRSYKRAVSSQRCVRAGGKHNDLANVGYTARHHTFFEMLGNFSFGDYFKKEAIEYAWEFVTTKIGLPADKLWVTVHKDDDESAQIWHKNIGVPITRIVRLDEDNFWQMGDTGPCGPCSEIFYDHGDSIEGDPPGGPNEGDRYIEIWNLVFMQFEREADGKMTKLPKPSVDTGMGLERMAAVLQGVHNNYETDIFASSLKMIDSLCARQLGDIANKKQQLTHLASQRIIADHIRSAAFLIADGVNPSNEGRGYVLRRIIRRGLRHGNKLKIASPFFYKLVEPLVSEMQDAHPLIVEQKTNVVAALRSEEEKFSRTLQQGLDLLRKEKAEMSSDTLAGEIVFKLYDTYGFPADLTEDIGREEGFTIDWAAFDSKMEEQRKRSRAYSMFKSQEYSLPDTISTSDYYEVTELNAKIACILDQEGEETKKLQQGQEGLVILDKTAFYAESGGQIGDTGNIYTTQEESQKQNNQKDKQQAAVFEVLDTQKQDNVFLHFGKVVEGSMSAGSQVTALVDANRRSSIAKHHTAAHLVHAALHQVLGKHAQQRGSRIAEDSLRLDFAHSMKVSQQELEDIEDWVNKRIRGKHEVKVSHKSLEDAKREGAMALFGEKYGEQVRVVDIPGESMELCGGTHCMYTDEIGEFILLKESSIAAGIRRIEGVVADYAQAKRHNRNNALNQIKQLLGTADESELPAQITSLIKNLDEANRQLQDIKRDQQIKEISKVLAEKMAKTNLDDKLPLLDFVLEGADMRVINDLADKAQAELNNVGNSRNSSGRGMVIILNKLENRNGLLISVHPSSAEQYPADQLIKYLTDKMGGSGGGKPTRAQGGLKQTKGFLKQVATWIEQQG